MSGRNPFYPYRRPPKKSSKAPRAPKTHKAPKTPNVPPPPCTRDNKKRLSDTEIEKWLMYEEVRCIVYDGVWYCQIGDSCVE